MRLIDNIKIAQPDLVLATATTFTTDTNVVDMGNYRRCMIILSLNQTSAATGTVTLKLSSDVAGTTEKALAFAGYLKNETGVTVDTLTAVTAATLTTAGPTTGQNTYVFEVKADDMDADNSFRYLRMDVTGLSANTTAGILYVMYEPRYTCGATDMPAAIA